MSLVRDINGDKDGFSSIVDHKLGLFSPNFETEHIQLEKEYEKTEQQRPKGHLAQQQASRQVPVDLVLPFPLGTPLHFALAHQQGT